MTRTTAAARDDARSTESPVHGDRAAGVPVVVHSFPSGDEAFRERVEAMLATGRFDDPMRLGEALRDVYPDIGVTRQLDFGRLRPHDDLWYVYRDGHMMGDGASEP